MNFLRRTSVPFISQTEISECGIACIAMVANYHGSSLTLSALRECYPQSLRGITLARLIHIAGELGFQTRPVQADLNALPRVQMPAILHWDLNHFVVLVKAGRSHIVVHDPMAGRLRMSYAEASRHFTGVALELQPGTHFKAVRNAQRVSLKSLTGGLVGLKRSLSRVLVLALALEAVTLLAPIATQIIIDQVVPTDDRSLLLSAAIGFSALLILQSCLSVMRSWSLIVLGADTAFSWSRNAFSHLMKLPATYFSNRNLGDIISRFDSINAIQHTITNRSIEVILDGMMAVITAVLLVVYSPALSAIPFTAFTLYCILRIASYHAFQLASLRVINSGAALHSFLIESIRGVQTIKLQNGVESRAARYSNVAFHGTQNRIAVDRLNMLFATGSSLILGFQRLFSLCFGAKLILDGELTIGALMVFLLYSGQLTERGSKLLDYLIEFRMLRLQTERLADIVLSAPEASAAASNLSHPIVPSIEFRSVSFRYDPSDRYIVKNCSFKILPGEAAAIVGPSGCGKTTLAKLLLGLLEPESGQILVGGIDILKIGKNELRTIASTVLQDDQIFTGSIEDNIHFFEPDADHERVVQAAIAAEIHKDVLSLPMGYQSLVGDLGSTLSAGQKQRLLLARALYRKPSILILDEATSHLDVANEQLVCAALRRINVTRIIIAHRPQTIAMADRVLLFGEDGDVRADEGWFEKHTDADLFDSRSPETIGGHVKQLSKAGMS